jgi:DNA-binding PadR family transcriptional regulator
MVGSATKSTTGGFERVRSLSPLEGGILGLLARGDRLSGWDIEKQARTSVAYFWPIGRSQIYAALPRLEKLGLIAGQHVPQVGKPDKRLFRLTRAGREALASWLGEGQAGPGRDLFLLRLFFGAHADQSAVRAQIVERRAEALELQQEIQRMSDSPDLDDFFHRLTRDFGIVRARGIIEWADSALEALDTLDEERSER